MKFILSREGSGPLWVGMVLELKCELEKWKMKGFERPEAAPGVQVAIFGRGGKDYIYKL